MDQVTLTSACSAITSLFRMNRLTKPRGSFQSSMCLLLFFSIIWSRQSPLKLRENKNNYTKKTLPVYGDSAAKSGSAAKWEGKKTINYKYNRRSWHTNQSIVNCQWKRISREVKARKKISKELQIYSDIKIVWRRVKKCIKKCLTKNKTKV